MGAPVLRVSMTRATERDRGRDGCEVCNRTVGSREALERHLRDVGVRY
jgi:hypothetical protein